MTEATGAREPVAPPTCYRHPGRETYVRCTRCDRPICPDCMVSASVGFQCPECVSAGNADVRQPRTVLGGSVSPNPGLVTRVLIGVNVALFLIELLIGINEVSNRFGLQPIKIANGEYYRLVTAGFLHASIFHILFNMLALYLLGTPLEGMLGRARYLLVFGMSLIGGSVVSFCFSPANIVGVGASGAIFGLMGAFVVVAWKQKLDLRPFLWLIGINLVIGFLPGSSIDWRAHLGGLVTGAVIALAIVLPKPEHRRAVLAGTTAVVLVVLAGVVVWRVQDLQPLVQLYFPS
jgi:membrane associated rhomboid family serine protease